MSATARFRYALVGGATAVVIGVGFTAVGLHQRDTGGPSARSVDVPLAAAPPNADGGGLLDGAASATPGTDTAGSTLPTSPSAVPGISAASHRPPAPKPKPHTFTSAAKKSSTLSAPATGSAILDAVLADINQARADAGLAALSLDTKLSKASALHNQLMIDGCGLQHQCPGEQGIGPRFSAQGVSWSSAGENIGFGSSDSSSAAIIAAATGLTHSMLAEKPPNDGHRQNLLSSKFQLIGLSVVRDGSGKTWMVQDFVD